MHRFPRGSTSRDLIHGRSDDGSGEGIFQVKHGKSSQAACVANTKTESCEGECHTQRQTTARCGWSSRWGVLGLEDESA